MNIENTKDTIVRELAEMSVDERQRYRDTIVRELAERKQKNGDLTKRDIDEVIDKYITIPDDKFLNEFRR